MEPFLIVPTHLGLVSSNKPGSDWFPLDSEGPPGFTLRRFSADEWKLRDDAMTSDGEIIQVLLDGENRSMSE